MQTKNTNPEFLDALRKIVGEKYVVCDSKDQKKYLADWYGRSSGNALAVVLPKTTADVQQIMALCIRHKVALIPQGGNTGLVGGALPDQTGSELVINLQRMNAIRNFDTKSKTITLEAGVILGNLHELAKEQDLEFPLTLGSQGSCTVGGILATNAGGTAVIRYGNARDLCLGLEFVTPMGEVVHSLKGLRKDNTGYDLRNLMIGSEGTLGIITAAVLKLYPVPKAKLSALVSMANVENAITFLEHTQAMANSILTGFELISDYCLQLVEHYFPQFKYPFTTSTPYCILLELSDHESEEHAFALLNQLLESALEAEIISDAIIPQSISQSNAFWSLREHIPLAQVEDGKNIKHDISLPISCIPEFLKNSQVQLEKEFPECRIIAFGHLGDGNLHFNVAAPVHEQNLESFLENKGQINTIIHDMVHALNGSISAEHGIGSHKMKDLQKYKSAVELQIMKSIKAAIDPHKIMNPEKIISGIE